MASNHSLSRSRGTFLRFIRENKNAQGIEERQRNVVTAETTKDEYRQDLLTSEHELSINGRRI